MKTTQTSLLAICAFALIARAEPYLSPSDLSRERILPNSTSPNGQLCFIEGFNGPTTATAIVLASTDLRRVLADASLATLYSTDKPYKGRITILWSPDSIRVATHDSINKHSKLTILRTEGDSFTTVPLPDLLHAACQRWGVSREAVTSSGQRPANWTAADTLTVEVSAKLKAGNQRTTTLQLNVPKDGAAAIQSK